MITIEKSIVQDIKNYCELKNYCRLFTDYNKEEELNELQEKIFNYFKTFNNIDNFKNKVDRYYYNDFYLSNEGVEQIINIIEEKLNNNYKGDFYLYSDKEIIYSCFNENLKKDALIIDLLENLNEPLEYMYMNLFCVPSSQKWYTNFEMIYYNIAITTKKITLYNYKDN